MATELPYAYSGTFEMGGDVDNLRFAVEELTVRPSRVSPVHGALTDGTRDTARRYAVGLDVYDVAGNGSMVLDANGAVPKGEASTITGSAGFAVKVGQFALEKAWPLDDVTGVDMESGTADDEKRWRWGFPDTRFSGTGWMMSGWDGDTDTQSLSTFTIAIDQLGTIALDEGASAILTVRQYRQRNRRGAAVPVSFQGVFSGGVAYSGSTNLDWLYPSDDDHPPEGTCTLNQDNAGSDSFNALLYEFGLSWSDRDGGDILFSTRIRRSKATS